MYNIFRGNQIKQMHSSSTLFLLYILNVVFPAQAEYSYFAIDFKLKIFLNYS